MNVTTLFLNSIADRGIEIQKYTAALSVHDTTDPWTQLRRLFHSLKSSAAMAGFDHLAHLAALAESATHRHTAKTAISDFAVLLTQSNNTPDRLTPANPLFEKIRIRLTPSPQVLIIDDDPFITEIIRASLDLDSTYSILTAPSGKNAQEILADTIPDIIVLDLMLEDMSGMELLHRITSRHSLRSTPVIVLTGSDEPDIRRQALAAGAACFQQKPFTPGELIAIIKELLNQSS